MLTQDAVRSQLDHIANEISRSPGIYYELYSRLFSSRVNHWIRSTPESDAAVIERVAQNDPDYLAVADEIDAEIAASIANPICETLSEKNSFNPDWDMSY